MKHKQKLIILIISFLLLVPFRLPISILLIELFNNLAQLTGHTLDKNILLANVTLTKLIYNVSLSLLMLYNFERLIIGIKERKGQYREYSHTPYEDRVWYHTFILAAFLLSYLCFDVYWTVELFNSIIL